MINGQAKLISIVPAPYRMIYASMRPNLDLNVHARMRVGHVKYNRRLAVSWSSVLCRLQKYDSILATH